MTKTDEIFDISSGLTDDEAIKFRNKYGSNTMTKARKKSFAAKLFSNLGDPIIRILLGAVIFNIAVTFGRTDWIEVGGIAVAVVISSLVSTLSERGSERAFEKLAESLGKSSVVVRRSGTETELDSCELVRGDVVLIRSGDVIPADGVIVGGEIEADQSALTGESEAVGKHADGYTAVFALPEDYTHEPSDNTSLYKGAFAPQANAKCS